MNEKSDDDDPETRGIKKQSELLQELLKGPDEDRKPLQHNNTTSQDDHLLRSLGFTNSPASPSRKRPHDDSDSDHFNKRLSDGTHVSSSAPSTSTSNSSKLSQKNKMLASLLAKQPSSNAPITPLPARLISATPQEISRVGERKRLGDAYYFNEPYKSSANANSTTTTTINATARGRGAGINRLPASHQHQSQTAYLNQILNQNNDLQRVPTSIRNQLDPNYMGGHNLLSGVQGGLGGLLGNNNRGGGLVSVLGGEMWGDTPDKMLSDILDQVIDIVPDAYVTGNTTLMNMISEIEAPQQRDVNEINAINAITASLMQCENNCGVRSPSSPVTVSSMPPGLYLFIIQL